MVLEGGVREDKVLDGGVSPLLWARAWRGGASTLVGWVEEEAAGAWRVSTDGN